MKPLVVLSTRDRFARANNTTCCGPSAGLLAEAIGGDFDVTDDMSCHPPIGTPVILCGAPAYSNWHGGYKDLTIVRGHVHQARGCETVCTFNPIDAAEVWSGENYDNEDDAANADERVTDSKDISNTSRGNYRFWFMSDIRKLLQKERRDTYKIDIINYANFIDVCNSFKPDEFCFLDIETHPETSTIQCLSIAKEDGPVYSIPVYDWAGNLRNGAKFFTSLVRLFQRCIVVGHNISFDTSFMAHFHNIPWPRRMEDTMLMHHRVFPEAEKSLGHAISYWINAPYHKNAAGTFHPHNGQQYATLLHYNALDVLATRAVWKAQRAYAATRPDLQRSFASVNRSIEVYLRAGYTGFEFSESARQKKLRQLETKLRGLTRIFQILAGSKILVTSPVQIAEYLYTQLKLRDADEDNSTAADSLYALLLKYPDVVSIRVLLEIRDVEKQRSMLQFKAYYRMEKR